MEHEQVYIHYLDWERKYDEWVPRDSPRLAAFRTHTTGEVGQPFFEKYGAGFGTNDVVGCCWNGHDRRY